MLYARELNLYNVPDAILLFYGMHGYFDNPGAMPANNTMVQHITVKTTSKCTIKNANIIPVTAPISILPIITKNEFFLCISQIYRINNDMIIPG